MQAIRNLFAKLFGKKEKKVAWDNMDFGKPSDAGDDFRRRNEA